MELRPYQKKVVEAIGEENAIVKMPTGSGKTFVAAEFVLRGLKESRKINENAQEESTSTQAALFLVPTCDLVTQQKRALKRWISDYYPFHIAEYFGGRTVPATKFDVLVSTPQAFLTLQQTEAKSKWFAWSNFFACVFDEVHHVLKDHPYRIIAHGIKAWEKEGNRVQIVGLSASLTYAVEHRAVEQALANLCHDLSVKKMISPTEKELVRSGYVPQDDNIETMKKPWDVPENVIPESKRRPHEMHGQFMQRVDTKSTTYFASKILLVVREIEADIISCINNNTCDCEPFKSPIRQIKLSTWEDYAYRMKCRARKGSAMQMMYRLCEIWYVALRMVVQSWEEEEQLVLQWLIINDGFRKEGWFSPKLESSLNGVERLCYCSSIQSEKLQSLTTNLIEKRKKKGVSFRGIVFVQQRISAYVLSQYLNNHKKCIDHGLHAGYVAARNSRITPSVKVRAGEATKCINDFRDGSINVIVATSVIEEGFDVPEANVVISFDYLKDTVELSQRFGRARQKTSSLTLMSERKDRPLSALKDVKTIQESIIIEFDPEKSKQVSLARKQSQNDRERAAFSVLNDTARCERSPLEVLNMYAAKTKATTNIDAIDSGPDKIFRCKIVYASLNRTMDGSGEGTTKKLARHQAAKNILDKLREMDKEKGM
ncbi:hypothetical protein ACHAXR_010799 [Thalassiosira sp. AJA248-18]